MSLTIVEWNDVSELILYDTCQMTFDLDKLKCA